MFTGRPRTSASSLQLSLNDLDAATNFVRFLAPLSSYSRYDNNDNNTFQRLGCATCHVPTLVTGPNPVQSLNHRRVQAYTDRLLHDMGPGLADICLAVARPEEFRTEPLMGLSVRTTFLHDGRAATVAAAILAHGGQASAARDRFNALSPRQRAVLLRYLKTL